VTPGESASLEPEREAVAPSTVADQPADTSKQDALGFRPYVLAVAEFLTHTNTGTPLTLSIEGEWGSGKSSFMSQVQEQLNDQAHLTVSFNAWRHEKDSEMWAAFALTLLNTLERFTPILQRPVAKVKRFYRAFDWQAGWFRLTLGVFLMLTLTAAGINLAIGAWSGRLATSDLLDGNTLAIGRTAKALGAGGVIILTMFFVGKLAELSVNPFLWDLRRYVGTPDYVAKAAFIESFHRDVKTIIEIYARRRRVFVFIDDLDRCDVPRAAELMQALNLMLSDSPRLVFVLGLDREKVAAGLAVKHEALLKYLDQGNAADTRAAGMNYGYEFLEKFIQLSFQLPRPSHADIARLMDRIGGATDEKNADPHQRPDLVEIALASDSDRIKRIVLMVAPALDNNPRRIKQFLNAFRLRAVIASRTGLFAAPEDPAQTGLTLERLGKFVAIGLRWPALIEDLEEHRALLDELQAYALDEKPAAREPSEAAKFWINHTDLLRLLRAGLPPPIPKLEEPEPVRLTGLDLRKLVEISPARTPSHAADRSSQMAQSPASAQRHETLDSDAAVTPRGKAASASRPSRSRPVKR
jgi:KAP family P-loop domain